MKKRILSLVMVISIIFSVLVPIQANAASNADEVIKSRIDELSSKLVGKYFTTDQNCCHNSSCEACKVNNVITQGWFTEEFETISDVNNLARYYYFDNDVDYTIGGPTLGEHSCAGFASFAEWYIFKESNSDRVETELVGVYPVSEVAQHAKLGDMLRIKWKTNSGSWSYHSGIYLGQNSPTSVYILDSNGLYKDENKVTVHDFTCEAVVITRAKNRDSVASNPADDPKPTDNPKPTPKETEEPIENLKYGDYLYYDINSDNTVTITKCDDEAEKIVIPETIDGMKVTVIGESAFADCGNLTSVKIPDSVIAIMNEAFYHCYRLPSITIPDSVTSIGDQAFCMCKLNSIILSNNLTSIGWAAFEGNPFFQDESNWENGVLYMNKYLIHANSTEISSDYTIKDGTRLIGDFAFLGSSLTSVTIPKSVTNIGEFAFEDCSGLTDVYYAGTKAQWDAISIELNNSELIYANIHCSDTEETKEPKKYGDYLYYTINKDNTITITRCDRLAKKIEIPRTIDDMEVISIEAYAFSGCLKLTSVKIPNSVVNIGQGAFYNCYNLETVIMSNSVTSIDRDAFKDCRDLTNVFYLGTKAQWNDIYIGTNNDELVNATIHPLSEGGYETPAECLSYQLDIYGMWYHITWCDEEVTHLVIPSSIGKWPSNWSVHAIDSVGNSENLKSVTIPSSISEIDGGAFSQCSNLEEIIVDENNQNYCTVDGNLFSIDKTTLLRYIPTKTETSYTIPDTVTRIDSGAFADCVNLKDITIPDSVQSIGEQAFRGCSGLTSITIPENVTFIDNAAFKDCSNLKVVYYNAINCRMPDSKILRYPAFENCTSVESVQMGNTVNRIPSYAFEGCENLKSITIPSSVEWISSRAFWYSNNLDSIYISDLNAYLNININLYSTYDVNDCLFESDYKLYLDNTLLTDLVIPNDVTTIKNTLFRKCSSLKSVTIPENVESVDDYAFEGCTGLESAIINSDAIGNGYRVFKDCSSLKEITILDNVTAIGNYAFEGCSNLNKITISNNVTSIGNSSFYGCTGLTEITIPNSVTSIGPSAFYSCTGLGEITIPDSVTSIGIYVFAACTELESVIISDKVETIGSGAFDGCNNLKSINVDENNQKYCSIDGNLFSKDKREFIQYALGKTDTSYEIPKNVRSIKTSACEGCTGLTEITIPNSVTSIGRWAFYGCTGLSDVYYDGTKEEWNKISIEIYNSELTNATIHYKAEPTPTPTQRPSNLYGDYLTYKTNSDNTVSITRCDSSAVEVVIPDKINGLPVTSIDYNAFRNCTSLTSVTIPSSVTSIEGCVFEGCVSLTDIVIPDSVENIGYGAFEGCAALENITIPDSVKYLGNGLFSGCIALASVTLPDGIEKIGYSTFENCGKLRSVVIPSSVKRIDSDAFSGCTSLREITIPNGVTQIGACTFKNCNMLMSVEIPDSVTRIEYEVFYNCERLADITIPDSVAYIGYDAFYNTAYMNDENNWQDGGLYVNGNLVEVNTDENKSEFTIKSGTKAIMSGAFDGCEGLTKVTIPSSVEVIGEFAFSACKNLTDITIPNSVKEIGESAFRECTSLISLTIPDSVTDIEWNAFANCTGLKNVTIGSGLVNLEDYVFEDCTSLESIDVDSRNKYYSSIDGNLLNKDKTEFIMYTPGKKNTSYSVPAGVKKISSRAFEYCDTLVSIIIPEGVTDIGYGAFEGCTGLLSITVPDSLMNISRSTFSDTAYYKNKANWQDGVLYIGNHLVEANADEISSVYSIKPGTKTIGNNAFGYCIKLDRITIPDSVVSIGEAAFASCKGLSKVRIPDSVTEIGEGAFYNCINLDDITVPDSVTSIGHEAFSKTAYFERESNWQDGILCIGNHLISADANKVVSEITIGDNIINIADGAFDECDALTNIKVGTGNQYYTSVAGSLFNKDKTVLVKYAGGKSDSHYVVPDGVVSIDDAFYGSRNLQVLTIPTSVRLGSYYTFVDCDSLTDIYYLGTEEEWYSMEVTNDLTGAKIHFGEKAPNPDLVLTSPDTYTLSNLRVTDNGVELTIQANEKVSGKQTVIVACYDEYGIFIGLQNQQITYSEEEQTIDFGIENENVKTVKAFIWNAVDYMMPASNSISLEI